MTATRNCVSLAFVDGLWVESLFYKLFSLPAKKFRAMVKFIGRRHHRSKTLRLTMPLLLLLSLQSPRAFLGEAFSVNKLPIFQTGIQSRNRVFASSSSEDEARRLKEEARRLKEEVVSFEQQKKNVAREEERKLKQELSQKKQVRMRFSAEVPILKGDGTTVVERVDFPPRIKDGTICSTASVGSN